MKKLLIILLCFVPFLLQAQQLKKWGKQQLKFSTFYTAVTGNNSLADISVYSINPITGILEEDPAGAATWTLPTAALAVAGITGCAVGDCIDFVVINTDGDNDIAITIAAGSGGSIVGNVEVESPETTAEKISSGSGIFRIRFTNVTSSSEAYVCYRIA